MVDKNTWLGDTIRYIVSDGVAHVTIDHQKSSVNKIDALLLKELRHVINLVKSEENHLKGLIFQSAKKGFIVGADINEFLGFFNDPRIDSWLEETHSLFNDIEDLKIPTVAAINGICLGGGFELALSCTYRVLSESAAVGLPETKLGIIPGWGGCVRLPRLIGLDNAIEWVASGKTWCADDAIKVGAVDALCSSKEILNVAKKTLLNAFNKNLNWQAKRQKKVEPLTLISSVEKTMAIESSKAVITPKAGRHYPAPIEAISVFEKTTNMKREDALKIERESFAKLAKTQCAQSLITIFLNDQANKKIVRKHTAGVPPIKRSAVIGAGIMGGGIAYQSASKGVPILMKDILEEQLQAGLDEASKLLIKQVKRKKIDQEIFSHILSSITPTLSSGDLDKVDIVVEAVVEKEEVKKNVLKELGLKVKSDTVVTSNTSTIPIDHLAEAYLKPENFCGMHFFNPVHKMPLVEIVRGKRTSKETISKVVQYARQIGKLPIVVNDCPGFLVNRILFPYFAGFLDLLKEGHDPYLIDKTMEKFGWPMGPAYLLDVIGLDTALHAQKIMASGYPTRMPLEKNSILERFVDKKRLGQKNKLGFYSYIKEKRGRKKGQLKKTLCEDTNKVISTTYSPHKTLSDEEVINRMMIPLINESLRCFEEKIVSSAQELDLALVNGIGFPPYLGGALKYLDSFGHEAFTKRADCFAGLGEAYQAPNILREYIAEGRKFY